MTGNGNEDRLRQLEQDAAAAHARLDNMEGQQRSMWSELRRVSAEGRDEFRKLRVDLKADTDELRELIIGNKLAGAFYSGGLRAIAWGIGTLIALGGVGTAIATAVKAFFTRG